jgi:hypothetical protein
MIDGNYDEALKPSGRCPKSIGSSGYSMKPLRIEGQKQPLSNR